MSKSDKPAKFDPSNLPDELELDISQFSSNMQIEVEDILNVDFMVAMKALNDGRPAVDDDGKKLRSSVLSRAMIYVGLKSTFPDITIEQAGDVPLAAMGTSRTKDVEPDE